LGLFPAVQYKLFHDNMFFYKPESACVGRVSALRKSYMVKEKGFPFPSGAKDTVS